jgi:hypothetical protein
MHSETVTDTGFEYRSGEPVLVHVIRRAHRIVVSDDGIAITKAGRVAGWHAAAELIQRESGVNFNARGVLSLPVVPAGPGLEAIVRRIGEASLMFYEELLELPN